MRLADGPRDRPVAHADDADEATALILDALADAKPRRAVGAKVESMAGHPCKGNCGFVASLELLDLANSCGAGFAPHVRFDAGYKQLAVATLRRAA